MKIITGLFEPDDATTAVRHLTDNGFSFDDLSMMSAASQMPEYLEGEPEESAVTGAIVGASTGSTLGVLGAWVASTIPGLEPLFVSGMMATAVGGVVGGYLGSLYSVRAETQTKIDVHEALEAGQILLVVQADDVATVETAVALLSQTGGQHIETHTVPQEEVAA